MALKTRKKLFLSDPAWKTLPWSQHDKSPRDHLLDILVDIPSLFKELDIMGSYSNPSEEERLKRRIWKGYLRLDRLLVDWHATHAPSEAMSPWHLDGVEIPQSITPVGLAAAHLMTLYWTTSIVLYSLVRDVFLSATSNSNRPPPQEDDRSADNDPSISCRNLIRTIPIFFHPDAGTYRIHLATFPISVALVYLSRMVKPGEMLVERELFDSCLRKPECATIRRFLASMRPEKAVGVYDVYQQLQVEGSTRLDLP